MKLGSRNESLVLLIGDVVILYISLYLTLLLRAFFSESAPLWVDHAWPFSFLFIAWILIFFISGLYEKHTSLFRKKLPSLVMNAQISSIAVAVLFFYFIPYFGITPKTNLFIFLLVSSVLIALWRIKLFSLFGFRHRQKAVIIGHNEEVEELVNEVNHNARYQLEFSLAINIDNSFNPKELQEKIINLVKESQISVVVADIKSRKMEELLPLLYSTAFLETKVTFLDIHRVYEEIFDRIPLSVLREGWILENLSDDRQVIYDVFKRLMDIIGGTILGLVTLVFLPFVYLGMKLEGKGPILLYQNRIGKNGQNIIVHKFRTMKRYEEGVWLGESDNKVTKLGAILRKTNLDEFPQALSIIKGELSLIGPRSDIKDLGNRLAGQIPFYNVRYFIRPGISGWAQIKQSYNFGNVSPQTIEENLRRLAYDLYYIKHRSIFLDIAIALRTITAILSRLTKSL